MEEIDKMDVFQYMPIELWKDMAERFLDPTSFGRLRQVNRALRDRLDKDCEEKMVKRCTITSVIGDTVIERFMDKRFVTIKNHSKIWYKGDKVHRDDDLPAIISSDGIRAWYKDGKVHRDNDLPALTNDGPQAWYRNGEQHRDNDLPAVINTNGTQSWYQNNKLHRNNDLPALIREDGSKTWYQDGKIHRYNGLPAVVYPDGTSEWYENGVRIK